MIELTQELWETMTLSFTKKARLMGDVSLEEIVGQVVVDTALVLDGAIKIEALS